MFISQERWRTSSLVARHDTPYCLYGVNFHPDRCDISYYKRVTNHFHHLLAHIFEPTNRDEWFYMIFFRYDYQGLFFQKQDLK